MFASADHFASRRTPEGVHLSCLAGRDGCGEKLGGARLAGEEPPPPSAVSANMTRLTRFFAGIFTLLALTFSFTASVWASTCVPVIGEDEVVVVGSEAPVGTNCAPGASHRCDRNERGRDCPSPAVSQACGGGVALPSHSFPLFAPSSEEAGGIVAADSERALLLQSTLFRPPRP